MRRPVLLQKIQFLIHLTEIAYFLNESEIWASCLWLERGESAP